MSKKIHFYLIVAISALSLQSCVSSYVVSKPIRHDNSGADQNPSLKKFDNMRASMGKSKETATLASFKVISNAEREMEIKKLIKKNQTIDGILDQAMTYIGTPYRFGGTTRSGIDCSAFVLSVYNEATGISLPRVSADQAREGESVNRHELEKGDLVFFSTSRNGRISHVGIVHEVTPEGDIKFIHSSSSKGVAINSLNEKYWNSKYRFAKRILTEEEIEGI